jgi:RNA polymerase sigma-B factor
MINTVLLPAAVPRRSPSGGSSQPALRADALRPDALFAQLAREGATVADRAESRRAVIECFLPLAIGLARRYQGRGEPLVDLTQVAVIGLIHAVDRFDPSRKVPFECFAMPTILGAIKRHFRDTTWTVRAPRRMQELVFHLGVAAAELAQVSHHTPTTAELASRLDVSPADVDAARLCANAYHSISFDQPIRIDGMALMDTIGDLDPRLDAVVGHEVLRVELAELSKRDQRIIGLRFFGEMTQTQIAAEVGISQMQVSRLLTRALAQLRSALLNEQSVRAA